MNLQLLFANKKFRYFLSFIIGLVIVGVYFRLQTPATTPISETPTPLIPPPNPDVTQKFTINWGSVTFPKVTSANIYQSSSLLNRNLVLQLATSLGFSASHQVDTKTTTDFVYVNNDKSLTVNLPLGPLTFSDLTPPASKGFTNSDPKNEVLLAVSTLLGISPANLQAGTPEFLFQPSASAPTKSSTHPQANLVKYSIHQVVDSMPIVSLTQSSATIDVILDNQYHVKQLEVYSPTNVSNPISKTLLTSSQVKSIANTSASLLPTGSDIETSSSINQLENINFTVTNVSLVYYLQDNSLVPVFRLDGTLILSGTPTAASIIVPALSN